MTDSDDIKARASSPATRAAKADREESPARKKRRQRRKRHSHDQYFKSLIIQYPREAIRLFDPKRGALLDDSVVITPIRQELPADRLGERFHELDVPLEIRWPDGRRKAIIIMIEQQTVPSRFRLKKMAIYYLLLSELCKTDAIVPVTVFLHRGRDIPEQLDMMVDDDRFMWFRYVSVVLPDWQAIDHIDTDNVVEQVLLTTMSGKGLDRVDIVGRAIRNLIRLEKDIDNVLNFEKFIRAYAQLDAEEERRYKEIYAQEDAHMMSVREELERKSERRGERRGRRIGREEGREEGRAEGREEGRQNARHTLISLLTAKFGDSATGVLDRVEAGSQEQLARWTLAVLTANTPEEVFRLQ